MFDFTGVLKKAGIGKSIAVSIATFFWTYANGSAAVTYGWTSMVKLLTRAAISAGVAGLISIIITVISSVGIAVLWKKLQLGKKKFIAW